ncbi:hypothetical protein Bfsp1_1 [Cytobacillus phage Bfsp1]|nr:hypothetical protein Bfsp1_1 [Cytobacillus phage Bfsp1]
MLYRKKTCIEVIDKTKDGDYWVQNEGDSSDRWIIPKETFEKTYEKVERKSNK